ncbi:MAG: hypothetical protein JKX84_01730 [Flavobacteriales bacterium]|nr:hypothetical protein [Flavobacteriales bacterium]
MTHKLLVALLIVTAIGLNACKDGCVTCSGPTAPIEKCPGDFAKKSDFQNYVSEYEQLEDGVCLE